MANCAQRSSHAPTASAAAPLLWEMNDEGIRESSTKTLRLEEWGRTEEVDSLPVTSPHSRGGLGVPD